MGSKTKSCYIQIRVISMRAVTRLTCMIMILSLRTTKFGQTVQTQVLEEQSDQSLHCLFEFLCDYIAHVGCPKIYENLGEFLHLTKSC